MINKMTKMNSRNIQPQHFTFSLDIFMHSQEGTPPQFPIYPQPAGRVLREWYAGSSVCISSYTKMTCMVANTMYSRASRRRKQKRREERRGGQHVAALLEITS